MNGVGIKTDGLAVSVVMSGESSLHVFECGSIIDDIDTIGIVTGSRKFRYQSMFSRLLKNLQPRVHQMGARSTSIIEEGIHWNLPEPRKLGFALANASSRQTVIGEAIVQSIWPESVSVFISDGDGGRCRRVVGELGLVQKLQGISGEVEVWGTETLDRCEWDAGESVEGDKVSVNLFSRGNPNVGHSRISRSHELGARTHDRGFWGVDGSET